METIVALLVFGATFGLGYWQLRGAASLWLIAGLAGIAGFVGLLIGDEIGWIAVLIAGAAAAPVVVFGYRWRSRRGRASAPTTTGAADAEKTCPECAEAVKADANVCRYCGHRFDETAELPQEPAAAQPVAEAGTSIAVAPAAAPVPTVSETAPATAERARFCARCGSEFEPEAEFCGTCGTPRP